MASKKSASKKAAKKRTAPKSVPINEGERREKAVARAKALYDWDRNAILNYGDATLEANLAELQRIIGLRGCTTTDICKYLQKLAAWLVWFQYDYTRLRRAVCNVERRAWGGPGDPALRFCSNGTGSEPADPTPPPIWS